MGDCLLDSTVTSWLFNANPIYSSRRLEPCTGPRYGEVTAVINDSRSPDQITAATSTAQHREGTQPSDDPVLRSCNTVLNPYLGLPPGDAGDGVDAVDDWTYNGLVIPAPAGPIDRQKAAGQHWVACLVTDVDPDKQTGNASVAAREYSGSAHQVYSKGRPPSVFAYCVPKMILPAILWPSSCSRAHTLEIFGSTETHSKQVTPARLDSTCVALVRRLTDMPDPTAGGQLTVTAAFMHLDEYGLGHLGFSTAEADKGFAICLVSAPGNRRLKGALLGLGTGPVPWA